MRLSSHRLPENFVVFTLVLLKRYALEMCPEKVPCGEFTLKSKTFDLHPIPGLPSQPPPLLKPSGSQAQRHPPPLQAQVGVPRTSQGGLQGPPPLIKPMVPPIRPQVTIVTMFILII